jgi:glycosyltransferase involved in cell wall biosynthesis
MLVYVPTREAHHPSGPHAPYANKPQSFAITVIVPNYNHAAYLRQRLKSIYAQTRAPDEILLLDDASTDDSPALLAEFAARDPVPGRTRFIRNIRNSGSPFAQWALGLRAATGDLVWIAESDDDCAPDFLARILPSFNDPAVLIAHGHTTFVDESGRAISQTHEKLFRSAGSRLLKGSRPVPAPQAILDGLGVRNLVPNASAVVFRRPAADFPLLDDPEWRSLRVCGDWLFYLHRMRGGKVAFVREALNSYRVHSANTSLQTHREARYYREHTLVAAGLVSLYRLHPQIIPRQIALLEAYHAKHHPEQSVETPPAPALVYGAVNLPSAAKLRLPNVLVALHAFVPGGAEGFAIRLAVVLRRLGCSVTLMELGVHPPDPAVLALVPADLPVLRACEHSPQALARILGDFAIEWVSTHHPRCDLALAKACDRLPPASRPRLFCTHHGFYHLDAANLFRHRLLFTRTVDLWINVASRGRFPFEVAGLLPADAARRFTDLPAAISLPPTPFAAPVFPPSDRPFFITVASRALPEKGWREAIAAVSLARSGSKRDLRLTLAGSGPVHDALATEGVPGFVSLAGFCADVPTLYAQSHLGLLATTYAGESCPLSIIECLSTGRPVVVTEIGETTRMLTSPDKGLAGTLVSPEPAQDYVPRIAAAIMRLATDSTAYETAAGCATACAKAYDINTVAAAYLAHYRAAG